MKKKLFLSFFFMLSLMCTAVESQNNSTYKVFKPVDFKAIEILANTYKKEIILTGETYRSVVKRKPENAKKAIDLGIRNMRDYVFAYTTYPHYDYEWFIFEFIDDSAKNLSMPPLVTTGMMIEKDGNFTVAGYLTDMVSADQETIMKDIDSPMLKRYRTSYGMIFHLLLYHADTLERLRSDWEKNNYNSLENIDTLAELWSGFDNTDWQFIVKNQNRPMYYYEQQKEDKRESGIVVDFDGRYVNVPFAKLSPESESIMDSVLH